MIAECIWRLNKMFNTFNIEICVLEYLHAYVVTSAEEDLLQSLLFRICICFQFEELFVEGDF